MPRIHVYILLFLIGLCCDLKSEEPSIENFTKNLDSNAQTAKSGLNLTVLNLENGMKVYLKPTNFESDEIIIKVSALGGYASLSPEDIASGQLASQIAWESGMGDMTSDQVSSFLYEHCLEFYPKIQAFSRTIEGSASQEGLGDFLNCIHMLFTSSNFSLEGYNATLVQAKASIAKKQLDFEHIYEKSFLATNTQNLKVLEPLNLENLSKVNFEVAKNFFRQAFSNPREFTCVIVGSFKNEEVKPLIKKYLESIPVSKDPFTFKKQFSPPFPKGITYKVIPMASKKDSLTRLTFPLSIPLTQDNITLFEFTCQLIEARLRNIITEQMKTSHGIDVAYEFPVYPHLDNPWMTIQFRSESKLVNQLISKILNELKGMQLKGVAQSEVDQITKLERGSDEFWLQDNHYWVAILSNYYLWGWNPEDVQKSRGYINLFNADVFNEILRKYFLLENYSIVTTQ